MVLSTRSKIRKHLLRLMPAVLFLLPAGRRTAHPAKRSRKMASEPVVTPGPDGIADEKLPSNPERNEASTIRANGKIRIRSVGEPKVQGKILDRIKPEPVNAYTGPLRGPRAPAIFRCLISRKVCVAGDATRLGILDTPTRGMAMGAIIRAKDLIAGGPEVSNVAIVR